MKSCKLLNAVLLLALIKVAENQPVKRQVTRLYSFTDNVELLTTTNFRSKVLNSTHAWLVEFYASWCGDCQRFAPRWKSLAANVSQWQDLVRLAVIDCSDELNLDVCRQYKIVRYPTVQYFPENYHESNGTGLFFSSDHENHLDPQRHLVNFIASELDKGRGHFYPDIRHYARPNLTDLFTNTTDAIKFGFLVVEEPKSRAAAEVALDLHKSAIVVRFAPSTNGELVSYLHKTANLSEVPVLLAKERGRKDFEIVSYNVEDRGSLKAQITNYLSLRGVTVVEESYEYDKNVTNDPIFDHNEIVKANLRTTLKKMGDVVFQADLEAAIRYSLKQEVATTQMITGEKLDALRKYLFVLKKYFPFGLDKGEFLTRLVDAANETNAVDGRVIGEIVMRGESNATRIFSTDKIRFLGCQGSASWYRRYPCSLWTTFHYLTVNAALGNVGNRRANPKEVLEAMHGYVKHFFSCSACSRHFQEMAKARNLSNVASLDGAVMWLWAAHNEVNGRLSGDATEDPEFPKYQFPIKSRCQQCYMADGGWNEGEVLKYLKHVYSSFNVRYVGADSAVLFEGLNLD